jgi:predicted ribonuclease YlaK
MARKKQNPLQVVSNNDAPVTLEKSKLCKVKYEDLKHIQPKNFNQRQFFELYDQQSTAILLHGVAGTGKTYIALYKALEEALNPETVFERVVIVRSAVPSREIGHLPGDEKEKT